MANINSERKSKIVTAGNTAYGSRPDQSSRGTPKTIHPHVYRYENHVVASLLVESGSPNYVFVALLRCDTEDMVVEKAESIQREPFAIADITKTWKQKKRILTGESARHEFDRTKSERFYIRSVTLGNKFDDPKCPHKECKL